MWSDHPRWRARVATAIACLAALIVSGASTGPIAQAAGSVVLVDFGDPAVVGTWTTVNDPVMGGRSVSTVTYGDGGLLFSGNISLENNGGFASARSPIDPEIGSKAAGATSLRVQATGDGKTYVLKVETGQPWAYIQRFPTQGGVRRTYDLPVGGFEPVGRFLNPEPNAPPLDAAAINRVALYILDKQAGPFQLTVIALEASQ